MKVAWTPTQIIIPGLEAFLFLPTHPFRFFLSPSFHHSSLLPATRTEQTATPPQMTSENISLSSMTGAVRQRDSDWPIVDGTSSHTCTLVDQFHSSVEAAAQRYPPSFLARVTWAGNVCGHCFAAHQKHLGDFDDSKSRTSKDLNFKVLLILCEL